MSVWVDAEKALQKCTASKAPPDCCLGSQMRGKGEKITHPNVMLLLSIIHLDLITRKTQTHRNRGTSDK